MRRRKSDKESKKNERETEERMKERREREKEERMRRHTKSNITEKTFTPPSTSKFCQRNELRFRFEKWAFKKSHIDRK